jgi:hypothetical protein
VEQSQVVAAVVFVLKETTLLLELQARHQAVAVLEQGLLLPQ